MVGWQVVLLLLVGVLNLVLQDVCLLFLFSFKFLVLVSQL